MLRTVLLSILAAIVCSAVCAVSSRFRPPRLKEHSEFRFLISTRAFIWIFTSTFDVGLVAAMSADRCLPVTPLGLLFAGSMATFGFVTCVWTDRFALKFFDDYLTYGAFWIAKVNYKDIVSAKLSRGGKGGPYLFIKTSRRTISICVDSLLEATQVLQSKLSAIR